MKNIYLLFAVVLLIGMSSAENISLLRVLEGTEAKGEVTQPGAPVDPNEPSMDPSFFQIQIFVPIIFAIVAFFAVLSLVFMDLPRDSLLYAKFIAKY